MVGKLMKYEFLRTRAPLAVGALVAIGLGLIAWGMSYISPMVAMVPLVVGMIVAFALPFATQLFLAIHLYRSTFGRRGYLEHAIPVKASTMLLTKFLYAFLVSVVSLLVSVGVLWLVGLADRNINGSALDELVQGVRLMASEMPWAPWAFAIFGLLTLFAYMAQFYFAVTVGSEAWINKLGAMGPVVAMVVLYLVMQVVGLVGMLIPPLFYPLTNGFGWDIPLMYYVQNPEAAAIPVVGILLPSIVSAFLLWRAVVSVNKKLELR